MKNYYFFKVLIALLVIVVVLSCNKEKEIISSNEIDPVNESLGKSRQVFAQALTKALQEEQVKEFIKNEALKKYDGDYDIVYCLVKNKALKDGKTFEEVLSKYVSPNDSINWPVKEPLLTIFVPELRNFSANVWNIKTQTPDVVIDNTHLFKEDKFVAYSNERGEYRIDVHKAPDYPVIVIKENERIIVKDKKGDGGREKYNIEYINSKKQINEDDNYRFYFIGDVDPNDYYKKKSARQATYNDLPPLLTWHFNNRNILPIYDQRDFIYYYILGTNGFTVNGNSISEHPKYGIYRPEYYEYIKGFKLTGSNVLANISNQWTEGQLEFHIYHSFIHRDGGLQSDLKVFYCSPFDLVDENGNMKEYDPNIELMGWDMYRYGDEWTFNIIEKDPGGSTKMTISASSNFGSNFEASVTGGVAVKVGVKFGATASFQKSSSQEVTITSESQQLGIGRLKYDTPVIYSNGPNNTYITNAAGSGAVWLTIEPIQKFYDDRPLPE